MSMGFARMPVALNVRIICLLWNCDDDRRLRMRNTRYA